MTITLIAAMDQGGVIGGSGKIPWLGRLPGDMRHFRTLTMGKTVVMGRKTFDSIGRPLVGRTNIVLTRDANWSYPEVITHQSPDLLFAEKDTEEELMVIGGKEIYELFLPHASRMHLTVIDHYFTGDTYFPAFSPDDWGVLLNDYHSADRENEFSYMFFTFVRL